MIPSAIASEIWMEDLDMKYAELKLIPWFLREDETEFRVQIAMDLPETGTSDTDFFKNGHNRI